MNSLNVSRTLQVVPSYKIVNRTIKRVSFFEQVHVYSTHSARSYDRRSILVMKLTHNDIQEIHAYKRMMKQKSFLMRNDEFSDTESCQTI